MRRFRILIILGAILGAFALTLHYRTIWEVRDLTFAEAGIGVVDHQELVQAVFATTESLLPGGGVYTATPGRRVQKAENIGSYEGETVEAPIAGIFLSETDGEESKYSPDTLQNAGWDALLPLTKPEPGTIVSRGAKIINNLKPSWALVAVSGTDGVLEGDRLQFLILNNTYTGTVMRLSAEKKALVIRFNQYINGTAEDRYQTVIWQRQSKHRGVVVPRSAIYAQGEEVGLYAVENGVINFRRVKIVDENEILVCVENVPDKTPVITNPREGLQGLFVRPRYDET